VLSTMTSRMICIGPSRWWSIASNWAHLMPSMYHASVGLPVYIAKR